MVTTFALIIGALLQFTSLAYTTVSITSNTDGGATCPGQELILTCVAENTVALRWRVFNSQQSSSFIEQTFTRRDGFGTREVEGVYTFILVSNVNNHFESTLSAVATQSLHNTVTECHSSSLVNSFTIKIENEPKRPSNLSNVVHKYQSLSATVEISWNPPLNDDPHVNYYHYQLMARSVTLNESLMVAGNVSNTSAIFDDLPYNVNLSFTLSAINCIGSSAPLVHNFKIAGCLEINSSNSLLQESSNISQAPGTKLLLSCVHDTSLRSTTVCQEDGRWEPDPHSFSLLCHINDSEIVKSTEMIPKVTNNTDTASSWSPSIYAIISGSAGLFLIVTSCGVLIIVVICVYQVRKRRRRTICRNLERYYEAVDEPIYETVLSISMNETHHDSKTQVWSDFDTNCNEAYQTHDQMKY